MSSSLDDNQNNRNKQKDLDRKWRELNSGTTEKGRKRYCGAFTLSGTALSGGAKRFARVDCKCWDCSWCGPRRANFFRHRIRETAEAKQLCRLITLRLDPKKIEGDAIKYLRLCFNKLRVYLRRKCGMAPTYIAVVELQPKSKNPHFHILFDRYIEQKWLKNAWESLGGGFEVDIRYVDIKFVSRYVSKYLTKEMLLSAPKGTRRITTSRSIKLRQKPTPTHSWVMHRVPIARFFSHLANFASAPAFDETGAIQSFEVNPNNNKRSNKNEPHS